MVKKEQNKIQEKDRRRTFRSMDITPKWNPSHHRIEAQGIRIAESETDCGDQVFKETWI